MTDDTLLITGRLLDAFDADLRLMIGDARKFTRVLLSRLHLHASWYNDANRVYMDSTQAKLAISKVRLWYANVIN